MIGSGTGERRWPERARPGPGPLLIRRILAEPFQRRTWNEVAFFLVTTVLGAVGVGFVLATMVAGAFLAVTVVGLVVVAAAVRAARGIGGWHRGLARHLLHEDIADPEPFVHRRGVLGWLQAALKDLAGWRAVTYIVAKMPLALLTLWVGFSFWIDALLWLGYPVWGRPGGEPAEFGIVRNLTGANFVGAGPGGVHTAYVFLLGVLFFFAAPWPMRGMLYLDRRLMDVLLGPDATTARIRTLEQSRAQTVDASAALLRRIERDLHDGTQAQLVALAMRLGRVREELAEGEGADLVTVRRLVDEAHRGAKEAITDLRDLARGIHPPVLDTGLESALTTLAARSPVPSEVWVDVRDRPTPAIEAIAYFCVAELLANVAQHAQASRAEIRCAQHASWLTLVVHDDGRGGATVSAAGSRSSGLAGLSERVRAVDGRLGVASPHGGPTTITVVLPCRA